MRIFTEWSLKLNLDASLSQELTSEQFWLSFCPGYCATPESIMDGL